MVFVLLLHFFKVLHALLLVSPCQLEGKQRRESHQSPRIENLVLQKLKSCNSDNSCSTSLSSITTNFHVHLQHEHMFIGEWLQFYWLISTTVPTGQQRGRNILLFSCSGSRRNMKTKNNKTELLNPEEGEDNLGDALGKTGTLVDL